MQLELKGDATALPPEPMEEMWQVEPPGFLSDLLKTAEQATLSAQADLENLAASSQPRASWANQPLLPGLDVGGRPLPPRIHAGQIAPPAARTA